MNHLTKSVCVWTFKAQIVNKAILILVYLNNCWKWGRIEKGPSQSVDYCA